MLLLCRVGKALLVGTYLFLGLTCALRAYGLIPEWGILLNDAGLLHELWNNPWYVLGAICWFGTGVFLFRKDL